MEVGRALKAKMDEGVVKREDLFITSKAWNTFHSEAAVKEGIKGSLTNLGLDYLDLYLIHWPMGYLEFAALFPKDDDGKFIITDVDYLETWRAFETCVKVGQVKSIGVSNFNSQQLQRVLDNCTIKPVCNQVECHPYLNQAKLLQFCKERDVLVTAYSPLGSPDRPWAKATDPVLMDDPKLKELATKYGKTVPQVLLRYQLQRGVVVIPKSVTRSRIVSNIDCFDFELSAADMQYIDTFDCNGRVCGLEWVAFHPLYPFHIEF